MVAKIEVFIVTFIQGSKYECVELWC